MKFLKLADYGSKLHKGVYTKPIVVLITPECISNCEVAAAVLKESKRAILVGSHTAGTGAGSYSYKNELEPKWTDQLHYTLKLRFPNQLFGIHPSSSQGELLDYEIAKEHTSENRPIVSTPSYEYETTLEDILHNGRGWKKMAIKALYPESRIEDLNPSLVP